jgi:hypothetical protein
MLDTIKMKYFLKIQEIEKQREETMATSDFQNWMKQLNVSRLHEDRSSKINAKDLQSQYDVKLYSKLNLGV